ncbi:putative transposase [Microseira wollei NIES-4236]|uniref:Transposase n=1 Tax=Microseira wollei NIES-4236 TaxID=2530354 RepID=A0AAV3X5I0_9CYAN|nr:putative transposase [Microseira wollei NIES-4236]
MLVLEFKAKGKTTQYAAVDEAIKTDRLSVKNLVKNP